MLGAGFLFGSFALTVVAEGELDYWRAVSVVLAIVLCLACVAAAIYVDRHE